MESAVMAAEPGTAISHGVRVEETTAAGRERWDAFVGSQRGAAGYHEWAWRGVFERSFGHTCIYLVAKRGEAIDGVLPLVEVRSLLFGRFMTSLPFVNYGGVLAVADDTARALSDTAREIAQSRGCRHVELRHLGRRFADVPARQHKVGMHLALAPDMWVGLDRKVRNQVRKAEKSALVVERGGVELVPDFYQVFARNMRDLGTPVYPRRFFDEIFQAFPGRTRAIVVRGERQPVAAGISYRTGATVEMPWASSLREFNSLCPNHLLYWHAIETAVAEGCETFDFDRSTPGGGTFKFKEQWGAEPVPLHWEYPYLEGAELPDQGPTNPKFQAAIAMWQRMPLGLANALGPRIVRGIP
jgi:FemAB-related protein (PEP-CTERM system-associated)